MMTAARRRRWRRGAAGVLAAATVLTLSGCGGDSTGGRVTLRMVAADYGDSKANSSQKYWDRLVEDFESEHEGIEVDVTVLDWADVDKEVAEMADRGEAPDIAQIGAYADYAAEGKLYSADQLLSIPAQADFLPGLAQAGEVHRTQYGLPFAASTRLLFYNKTLFEKAGVTGPPRSWEELRQAARALEDAGVKTPYALPLGPEEAQAETMMWMLGGGGGYTDNINSYVIDSPENVRTFEWLRDEFVGEGLTGTDPGGLNRQEAFDAFARGEVGMLNGHPTLMRQAEQGGVKYGMAPLPGREGESEVAMGVADWLMAFKENGHRKQVGTFLDFVYGEENVRDFSERYDLLPVTNSASEAMRADEGNEHLWDFLDQLPAADFYPSDKTSWAQVSRDVKAKAGSLVRDGADPAGVLSEIQRDAARAETAVR
ncbi:ABC transporter substrate-binding protein [Streptomyces lycii]|nr:extracellular solute-binding protein [Streptomyces lycii]